MSAKKIEALYLRGKGEADPFAFYYVNMRPLLWKYARAIAHQNTNHLDDHLIDEMVDDLLMSLDQFEGRSNFTTWAYTCFRRKCIDEFRYARKNLGDSLDSLKEDWRESLGEGEYLDPYDQAIEPTQEHKVILGEFKGQLSKRQLAVLEARLEGNTFEEIGEQVNVSASRAHEIWASALELAKEYGQIAG